LAAGYSGARPGRYTNAKHRTHRQRDCLVANPAAPCIAQPWTDVPWLKLLHLAAVTVWCAALLYLPLALTVARDDERFAQHRVQRLLFTSVATPAALIAIASGTLIFLWQGPLAPWLIAKLAVVGLLVLMHASLGLLVLRSERGETPSLCLGCGAVLAGSLLALAATAWLVLAKPAPWTA
jgi:uncharacterized membrane protein